MENCVSCSSCLDVVQVQKLSILPLERTRWLHCVFQCDVPWYVRSIVIVALHANDLACPAKMRMFVPES